MRRRLLASASDQILEIENDTLAHVGWRGDGRRLLRRALHDASSPPMRLLPLDAADLLERLDAPPRLAAHLRIVHGVACQLADWTDQRYPALTYQREAMLFGAATHDIGKTIHTAELSAPGSEHEETGRQLLLAAGSARNWPASPPPTHAGPARASASKT